MNPTRAQLATAHRAAGLKGSLDDALLDPLLARCLALTAEASAHRIETPPPAGHAERPVPLLQPHQAKAPLHDFKRACAADMDD